MDRQEMERKRKRLCKLADTILRGKRYEAADSHIFAMRTLPEEIQQMACPKDAYHEARYHFLCGWDEAMELKSDELRDENSELHGMVIDLCQRLMVRRCETCKGLGVDDALDPCPNCDGGWSEVKTEEPERIVAEVKKEAKRFK